MTSQRGRTGMRRLPSENPFIRLQVRKCNITLNSSPWSLFTSLRRAAALPPACLWVTHVFKKPEMKEKKQQTKHWAMTPCSNFGVQEKEWRFHSHLFENSWCKMNSESRTFYWKCWHHLNYSTVSSDPTTYACTHLKEKRPCGFMLHITFQEKSEGRGCLFLSQLWTSLLLFQAPCLLDL